MIHELPSEMGGDIAVDAADILNPRKKRLLTKVGLSLGVLAAAFTAATARPNQAEASSANQRSAAVGHPLEYVGVTSNRIWVTDLDQARTAAQNIAATNANTVRIFEPYNMAQTQIDFDRPRLCNAAEAARENNLTLEISVIGVHRAGKNGGDAVRHNYVPSSAGGVSRYLNFTKSILLDIAGPNSSRPGPNGEAPCVEEPLSKVIIEDFNEVNSKEFDSNVDAAKGYAFLESRAIPAYAKISSDINNSFEGAPPNDSAPHLTLIHAVGALAAANHDPVGFLKDFDREIKQYDIQDPNFLLSIHPYPANSSTNPAQVESNLYGPLRSELDSTWGKDVIPIFYDEIGVNAISPKKRFLYGPRSLQAATVDEGSQAQYYKDAMIEAASESGVVGELTFQSQDVRNDGWPSGVYDPSGKRKDSWNTVAQTFHDAIQGSLQK